MVVEPFHAIRLHAHAPSALQLEASPEAQMAVFRTTGPAFRSWKKSSKWLPQSAAAKAAGSEVETIGPRQEHKKLRR
jgi:hypothetical protein